MACSVFFPGGDKSGTPIRAAISIKKAAYIIGCAEIDATINAQNSNPNGRNSELTLMNFDPKYKYVCVK